MKQRSKEIERALEAFVRGFTEEKSRTWPYEFFRVGKIRVMRDAQRRNPRDYRSVDAGILTWCSSMHVFPAYRRRSIGSALLCHMLKDDRRRGFQQSVLLSSQTGALLYPRVGYEQIGLLYIFAPRK